MKRESYSVASGVRYPVPVSHGAGDRWYLDAELSATGPTAINLSFLSGAVSVVTNITWVPLNLLTADNQRIRRNDSVMFNMQPAGQTNGTVAITVKLGANTITNLATTIDQPVTHRFATAGTYTVTPVYSATKRSPLVAASPSKSSRAASPRIRPPA